MIKEKLYIDLKIFTCKTEIVANHYDTLKIFNKNFLLHVLFS